MDRHVSRLERGIHENVIHRQRRKGSRVSATGAPRLHELADVAQVPAQRPVRSGTGKAVEIAEEDERCAGVVRREPVRTRQQLGLETAFTSAQTEMSINDMDRAEVRPHIHRDRGALLAAKKRPHTRETFGAAQGERVAAENGMAIMSIALRHRGVEMPVPAKLGRDRSRLVDPGRPVPAEIEFLQADDVHVQFGNHLRDPRLRAAPIRPDATVDVIGGNP